MKKPAFLDKPFFVSLKKFFRLVNTEFFRMTRRPGLKAILIVFFCVGLVGCISAYYGAMLWNPDSQNRIKSDYDIDVLIAYYESNIEQMQKEIDEGKVSPISLSLYESQMETYRHNVQTLEWVRENDVDLTENMVVLEVGLGGMLTGIVMGNVYSVDSFGQYSFFWVALATTTLPAFSMILVIVAAMLAGGAVVAEHEDKSIRMALLRPATRTQFLGARYVAVLIQMSLFSLGAFVVGVVTAWLACGFDMVTIVSHNGLGVAATHPIVLMLSAMFGMWWLGVLSVSLFVALGTFVRSRAFVIVIGALCAAADMALIPLSMITTIPYILLPSSHFDLVKYLNYGVPTPFLNFLLSFFVGLVFVGGMMTLAFVVSNKRRYN